MPTSRYAFDVIDADGTIKQMEDVVLPDMNAVLDRVSQIGFSIDRPGCRIRVKNESGSRIFVGVTTGQGSAEHTERAA